MNCRTLPPTAHDGDSLVVTALRLRARSVSVIQRRGWCVLGSLLATVHKRVVIDVSTVTRLNEPRQVRTPRPYDGVRRQSPWFAMLRELMPLRLLHAGDGGRVHRLEAWMRAGGTLATVLPLMVSAALPQLSWIGVGNAAGTRFNPFRKAAAP
jgi:hypothetical protein